MEISIEQMLKAGVHFGHQTRFWNPKMEKFIFGSRNKVHIIDLQKTLDCLEPSLDFCKKIASSNNRILFVGTKRSAREVIRQEAERCGMPYVNHRWLGGMLTNYKTIRASIRRYEFLVSQEEEGKFNQYTKKEVLKLPKNLKQEFSDIRHDRGIVSMARASDPDSADSQFFIVFDQAYHLDGKYTVWGKVVSGMQHVDKLKKGSVANNGVVADPDVIVSLQVAADAGKKVKSN